MYKVYATWNPAQNRSTETPFTILDGNTVLATVRVDQQQAPNDILVDGLVRINDRLDGTAVPQLRFSGG